jgi:hypothetical protein
MARIRRLLAQALVILGLAPMAYALGLLGWQAWHWALTRAWVPLPIRLLVDPAAQQAPQLAAIAPYIPGIDWAWANHPHALTLPVRVLGVVLDRLHVGLIAVLLGWAIIALGRAMAARQDEIIEWQERQRADRLRRAAQYRI